MRIPVLISYTKTDAAKNPLGEPSFIVGSDQEQAAIFVAARTKNKFPPGVEWLGFGIVNIQDAAALMGTPPMTQVKEAFEAAEKKPAHEPKKKNQSKE